MNTVILPHLKVLEKDSAKGSEFLSGKLVVEGASAPCSTSREVTSASSAVSPERGSSPQPGNRAGQPQLSLACSKKIT